jgi:hypothetical protein
MGMLTDIRVPLPQECETQLDCHRHLGEISDRLTGNLRARLGDGFEVLRDVRPVAFGGQWSRATRVYRDGELRATFSVAYDYVLSPHDFEVSCLLPTPATAVPRAAAIAVSILVAGGATAFGGPLAGALAGGSTLLAAILAARAWPFGRTRRSATREEAPFDVDGGFRLDPLLG